jgi:hypothetical protein
MKARPEDWARVVAAHSHDTLAFIASSNQPSCLKMVADEVAHIHRWMRQVTFGALPAKVPESWFLAAIVLGDEAWGGPRPVLPAPRCGH